MPLFSVLIPTHCHARLIPYSIASVSGQTISDIEILVVGDGADDETRRAVAGMMERDDRIRYFDFPKGERHGEASRHAVLQQAKGKNVAYLCDDDLWLPQHLENLERGLRSADFVHTIHVSVLADGSYSPIVADLEKSIFSLTMLLSKRNFFGPTVVGHSMAAYRALRFGWRPAPQDVPTDLHMWRQFLLRLHMRFLSIPICDTLHFPSPLRLEWSSEARESEIRKALEYLNSSAGIIDYLGRTRDATTALLNL